MLKAKQYRVKLWLSFRGNEEKAFNTVLWLASTSRDSVIGAVTARYRYHRLSRFEIIGEGGISTTVCAADYDKLVKASYDKAVSSPASRIRDLADEIKAIATSSNPTGLQALLEKWSVLSPGQWKNDKGPKDWFAVCSDDGILAYFADEITAFRFRLAEINRELNG